MKLSEKLRQDHECGDFGKALAGMPEEAEALESRIAELERTLAGAVQCGGELLAERDRHVDCIRELSELTSAYGEVVNLVWNANMLMNPSIWRDKIRERARIALNIQKL